jgi:hypothetical protein
VRAKVYPRLGYLSFLPPETKQDFTLEGNKVVEFFYLNLSVFARTLSIPPNMKSLEYNKRPLNDPLSFSFKALYRKRFGRLLDFRF